MIFSTTIFLVFFTIVFVVYWLLLDANELLDGSHFIEYESGDRKGMIEPLHFDTKGHEKLAEYIKNKIEL